MNIVDSYIDEIKDNLDSFEGNLNIINKNKNNNGFEINIYIKKIDELIQAIESDISSLKLEYSSNKGGDINKDQNIKLLFQKYDQLKLQYNKTKLLDSRNSNTFRDEDGKLVKLNYNGNDTKDKVARLNKIHENNLQMIKDARVQLSNMTNTAIETNMELKRQTEQMRGMEKKFDEIDASLDQSKKTVDKMSKRWF
ncbi:hypothetical protein DICPUDRAFT_82892 [Dictyostelium purpureum]|uniref:t-SNARE coiled-coil homology domain-containing protein n=1 Tax=Dictyostelium purpureum TaxID=5786 RepID=F0ZXY1_DICPU|nr:uncharacterized protein DICPUDRAFT_82892 [Dictyostelium purpureum]EGC31186.1 hypothetical protein DICPUDRAFT_82892 [Dictyostelium purpureum]|eukprot:XP_003292275.1 hypothetical protein DICPUDRAFT_82892 [Dictyostelium purpureum]